MTYEGENNVLLQQSSNWLLSVRQQGYDKFADSSPLASAVFLRDYDEISGRKFHFNNAAEALNPSSEYTLDSNVNKVGSKSMPHSTPIQLQICCACSTGCAHGCWRPRISMHSNCAAKATMHSARATACKSSMRKRCPLSTVSE